MCPMYELVSLAAKQSDAGKSILGFKKKTQKAQRRNKKGSLCAVNKCLKI